MAVSKFIKESMSSSSWIRKMFEEGIELKKKFGNENVYDFSLGNPDLFPPEKFSRVLLDFSNEKCNLHGYMPNAGFVPVREIMAQKVKKDHNCSVSSGDILMTVGAAGGLNVVLKTILNPDDEVCIIAPFFAEYKFYISNHNGKTKVVESNEDFSINLDNIKKAICAKTAAIIINTPNNPTGKIYTVQDITALCDLLKKCSEEFGRVIYLISDEPYREISYDGACIPSILDKYNNAIIVYSFSKSLSLAGERIGYIAINPACDDKEDVVNGLALSNRILGFVNAPAMMQRAVAELVNEKVDVDSYRRRKELLCNGLSAAGISFIMPEGAFYVFAKSPVKDEVLFINHLKNFNILAVPGRGFGREGYFRLAFCVSEETIRNSLSKFKEAMNSFAG